MRNVELQFDTRASFEVVTCRSFQGYHDCRICRRRCQCLSSPHGLILFISVRYKILKSALLLGYINYSSPREGCDSVFKSSTLGFVKFPACRFENIKSNRAPHNQATKNYGRELVIANRSAGKGTYH